MVASPAGASAPEATGEREHGLVHPNAAIGGSMLEVEETMKKQFEDSGISTAGDSDGKVTDELVHGASLPDGVWAASSLDANSQGAVGKAEIFQTPLQLLTPGPRGTGKGWGLLSVDFY